MKADSTLLRSRTAKSATALLLAGGLLLSGNTIASALDLGSLNLGSLSAGSLGAGSSDAPLAPTAHLASISNFRDIAGNDGQGYVTITGQHMNRGVIYRANSLASASDADQQTLTSLDVTKVYDLRGSSEITNPLVGGPDKIPAGTDYVHIPIEFADLVELAQTIESPEQGRQFMEDTNRSFVTDPARRAGFKQLLTDIANGDGAQLFHCTSGKDRTGWTAALLQTIAGLPQQTIMDDYLLSNDYLAQTNQRTLAQIRGALGDQAALNLTPVLGVEKSFLEAGFAQVRADYGSIQGYLTNGLGLDGQTLLKLAAKLLG